MTGTLKCVVIMPYGIKTDHQGNEIDFDAAYREVIQEAAQNANLDVLRIDEIESAGDIHEDMFFEIATADVAIVDITMLNPNVFYELGARHVLKPAVTVLVRQLGASVPFNIHGQRIIDYPSESGSYRDARQSIQNFIVNGLESGDSDSPWTHTLDRVQAIKEANDNTKRIDEKQSYTYKLSSDPHTTIEIRTGDLLRWPGVDVWVNSENTNLQMARFYDRNLSAIIRYHGAEKDENDAILRDTVADALLEAKGSRESVNLGSVIVTPSGDLEKTHELKRIFHVASVHGIPGHGYRSAPDIVDQCVERCLTRMFSSSLVDASLRTIAFPMLGTGAGGGDVHEIAKDIVSSIISVLSRDPETPIDAVYLMAWNGRDLEACQAALNNADQIERVSD